MKTIQRKDKEDGERGRTLGDGQAKKILIVNSASTEIVLKLYIPEPKNRRRNRPDDRGRGKSNNA